MNIFLARCVLMFDFGTSKVPLTSSNASGIIKILKLCNFKKNGIWYRLALPKLRICSEVTYTVLYSIDKGCKSTGINFEYFYSQ